LIAIEPTDLAAMHYIKTVAIGKCVASGLKDAV